MARRNIGKLIGQDRYSKTSFGEKWSEITKKNTRSLSEDDLYFVRECLALNPRFTRMADDPNTKITVVERKFQRHRVRGVTIISPNTKIEIWVGKKAMCDALFPPTRRRKIAHTSIVLKAMRQVVETDVALERQVQRRKALANPSCLCPLSGIPLCECEGTHLDHIYPLSAMAEDFFRMKGIDMETVDIDVKGTFYKFTDLGLAVQWRAYHKEHAKLQLTCAKENIKKSNKII